MANRLVASRRFRLLHNRRFAQVLADLARKRDHAIMQMVEECAVCASCAAAGDNRGSALASLATLAYAKIAVRASRAASGRL